MNTICALKSFRLQNGKKVAETIQDFLFDGYLVFANKDKANNFLELCSHSNKEGLKVHYEYCGEFGIEDTFIMDKIKVNSSFYTRNLKDKVIEGDLSLLQ